MKGVLNMAKDIYCSIPSYDQQEMLSTLVCMPNNVKAIIQFSHGMAEHKERYVPFMHYLNAHGYGCVIHDHRGHGDSVKTMDDFGHFNDKTYSYIIEDLHVITQFIKKTYPGIPVYMYAHSMGTLVARNYIKKYDYEIEKLVLSGSPYKNTLAPFGFALAKIQEKLFGERHKSSLIQNMAIGSFDKKFSGFKRNRWISVDEENVEHYNAHEKCGFVFTINGFQNLFHMMISCFKKEEYQVQNETLTILFIAGEEDPVIGSKKQFAHQYTFLKEVGYPRVTYKLYPHMRHEILNEKGKMKVYQDVLTFFYY